MERCVYDLHAKETWAEQIDPKQASKQVTEGLCLPRPKFGCQLPQDIPNPEHLIDVAKECESLGYDSVWAYDHLSPYWLHSGIALECWTLLSAVAARTSKIRVGSLVTNVNLRNPALLAKMTSTVDCISGGRLIVGLGTGDRLSAHEMQTHGYQFPSLEHRIDRLRETILILRAMWTGEKVSVRGKTCEISNALSLPKPKQKPGTPIWIGGRHKMVLDVVVELADGWNYWGLNRQDLEDREKYLFAKCAEVGRPYMGLVKSWTGKVDARKQRSSDLTIVEDIKRRLLSQTSEHTDYFIASFGRDSDPNAYEAFAEAVKSFA
ncbi:MAG TPA: LLM class flavin-dependent oxidoreductase [Candidatus Acidoferrales bacterium]|nr:LLM class flavin-dependent oxidoreductase [Candidatus Acidoferrales bacterium]